MIRRGLVPGSGILSNPTISPEDLAIEDLRAAVAGGRKALEAGRIGIGRECFRPPADAFEADMVQREMAITRLADAFFSEGVLAEREGRFRDAARTFGDTVVLGAQWTRGGILIDYMVGTAKEICGLEGIAHLRERLDGPAAREALGAIARAAGLREPFESAVMPARRTKLDADAGHPGHPYIHPLASPADDKQDLRDITKSRFFRFTHSAFPCERHRLGRTEDPLAGDVEGGPSWRRRRDAAIVLPRSAVLCHRG